MSFVDSTQSFSGSTLAGRAERVGGQLAIDLCKSLKLLQVWLAVDVSIRVVLFCR